MNLQLEGKAALVTGSSKGIGEAIARTLAREGAHVIVHGREEASAQRVASYIRAQGGIADVVIGDLTSNADVDRLLDHVDGLIPSIDILVNNAGGSGPKDDWATTVSREWESIYDRNVIAAVRLCVRLLPDMRRAKWGRIVNVSSVAAKIPPITAPAYSAAKAAMNAMTVSMAKAAAADGVTVNTVSPGTIRSDRAEQAFREAAVARGLAAKDAPWEEIERAVLPLFATVPMSRMGRVDELADAVAFLASERASYVTGVNLPVDGGFASLP